MDKILKRTSNAAIKFLQPLSPEKTYATIVNEAIILVGADYGSLYLEQDGELVRIWSTSPVAEKIMLRKSGRVWHSFDSQQVFITQLKDFPKTLQALMNLGIKSNVFIPLVYRRISIGVLVLNFKQKKNYPKDVLEILKLYGSMASLAIKKNQLQHETQEAIKARDTFMSIGNILEKVNRSAIKFLEPLAPQETYATVVNEAVKLVGAEYGTIMLQQEGELRRVYSSAPVGYITKSRKRANTYKAFTWKKVIVAPISEIGRAHPEVKAYGGIKWTIFIPLSYRGQSIGVLSINSRSDEKFNNKELNILKLFGSLASLAIRKTQLYYETQKALETRDLFISIAAHELRTPLTTINGYIQLLGGKLKGKGSAESRWTEELSWEAYRLTQLVNELLEVNRIKSGSLHYVWHECHLKEVIQRAISNLQFSFPNRKVSVMDNAEDDNDVVVGDFDKLIQVIINLLENAAKFSPESSEIVLDLKCSKQYILIRVVDKGNGIHEKELSKVFEDFYRGSDQTTAGMGLGLFLSKNIIAQHHGSIDICSKINRGTTVEVKLPVARI